MLTASALRLAGPAVSQSHTAVLQERLDVLRVAGGRGQGAGALSVCGGGAAGFAGGAGLDVGQSVVVGDEDGDEEGE